MGARQFMRGMFFWLCAALLFALLWFFSPADPSFNHATDSGVRHPLGRFGSYGADVLLQAWGAWAFLLPATFFMWGLLTLIRAPQRRIAFLKLRLAMAFISMSLLSFLGAFFEITFDMTHENGAVGHYLGMQRWVSEEIAIIAAFICLVTISFSFSLAMRDYAFLMRMPLIARPKPTPRHRPSSNPFTPTAPPAVERKIEPMRPPLPPHPHKPPQPPAVEQKIEPMRPPLPSHPQVTVSRSPSNPFKPSSSAPPQVATGSQIVLQSDTPPFSLLHRAQKEQKLPSQAFSAKRAEKLTESLSDFGIAGVITDIKVGPVVTLFEFEPAAGVKMARIQSLTQDIARAMSSVSVRVSAIRGRNVIGIEVAYDQKDEEGGITNIHFGDVLDSCLVKYQNSKLPLVLGFDIGGRGRVADLALMPHLLMAGTTGAGKTVSLNGMILSLAMRHSPQKMRFVIIDPKMLDLSIYEHLPHLLFPVVTHPNQALNALKWLVREMERRYALMASVKTRSMEAYHLWHAKQEHQTNDGLPYLIVVIDEMADLMMTLGKEVEEAVQRLTQKARQAGIHLVMATQRPSVDVITGVIKANFSTRIAFRTASKIDSRTIIGMDGAEELIGRGDMLFSHVGGAIDRLHGAFVSEQEIEEVLLFLNGQHGAPNLLEGVLDQEEHQEAEQGEPLFAEALAIMRREGRASASLLQSHLNIGYPKAARLMRMMEEQGIVSKADKTGRRTLLIRS